MARILIAEDETDIRNLITFTLRFAGHEVIDTANGIEALEKAQEMAANDEIPDLIILDVRMPRMTGYEVCERIIADDQLKDVPVAFLSAKGQEVEVQTGFDAGAIAYIVKPFSPDELTENVLDLLNES